MHEGAGTGTSSLENEAHPWPQPSDLKSENPTPWVFFFLRTFFRLASKCGEPGFRQAIQLLLTSLCSTQPSGPLTAYLTPTHWLHPHCYPLIAGHALAN